VIEISETEISAFIKGLESRHHGTRGYAAWRLGKTGDSSSIEPLTKALERETKEHIKHWIAEALLKLTGSPSPVSIN
jgi:HEAT repeat protein